MTALSNTAIELGKRFTITPAVDPDTSLCWLNHEGVIAIDGPDAERFLQGQLTCDAVGLGTEQFTLGARCNPKGRMQSSFTLQRSETGFLISIAQELIDAQITELSKYAAFFKAQLTDQSAQWVRLGLWGENTARALDAAGLPQPAQAGMIALTQDARVLRLQDGALDIWLPASSALTVIDKLQQYSTADTLNRWLLRQIQAGVGQVTGATAELFIPQMLNLQQLGGVSFKKGCYTGQEIVARMQYLGKLKRRMYRLLIAGDAPPQAGTPIIDRDSGKAVGEVVIAAKSRKRVEVLAVLQKDAAQLATLSAGNAQGPLLTLADLPYEPDLTDSDATAP